MLKSSDSGESSGLVNLVFLQILLINELSESDGSSDFGVSGKSSYSIEFGNSGESCDSVESGEYDESSETGDSGDSDETGDSC